jgi:hypothetical protein
MIADSRPARSGQTTVLCHIRSNESWQESDLKFVVGYRRTLLSRCISSSAPTLLRPRVFGLGKWEGCLEAERDLGVNSGLIGDFGPLTPFPSPPKGRGEC